MPRNASTGVYTPPSNSWNPATPDTVISSADWNALRTDMVTALHHAPATTRALHPTTGQVQDGAFLWGGTAGGTADALTLTLTPAITAYVAGLTIRFRVGPAANITPTPTLAVNGLAAHTIKRYDGAPLAAGDLPADAVVEVLHDGTSWRLLLTAVSQIQGDNSAINVTSATSIILNNVSPRVQGINITTDGQSVFLPDAKTLTTGGPRFYIRNVGSKTFALRPSNVNQIVNGGFDNSAGWTLGTGWTISGGVATKSPGSATDIEQTLPTASGAVFLVTFTITSISIGTVRAVLKGGGPDVLGPPRSAPGTYTETLTSKGNTTLALRADASFSGSIDNVIVTLLHPDLLAGMPPGSVAECVLENNATVQGRWHIIGKNTTPAFPIVNALLPSLLPPSTQNVQTLKLSETVSLHFAANISNHPFVFAVDHGSTPPVIGTPVLISASNSLVKQAFRISDNKALIAVETSNACNCFIVSVSGTTCNLSASVAANVFAQGEHSDRPLTATLGANNDLFVAIDAASFPNIRAQAVDASGTVPSAGSAVNIFTAAPAANVSAISIFRIDDNKAVAFYLNNNNSPSAVVLTVTGTSIAVGTSASINDVISDINNTHGVVCQISNTSYLWVYGQGTNVRAVAVSVSGASVTFGTPITFATLFGAWKLTFDLGNRYNPIIFPLSGGRVFVAIRKQFGEDWMCLILTVSGLLVAAGPVLHLFQQEKLVFLRYNDEHTVLVQRGLANQPTGGVIGLDHGDTSISSSGSITPVGIPTPDMPTQVRLSNGLVCVQYQTLGLTTPMLWSPKIEVFAPSPNSAPLALGHFTVPDGLHSFSWIVEASYRRLAFVDKASLGSDDTNNLKLCIMEMVSWPH